MKRIWVRRCALLLFGGMISIGSVYAQETTPLPPVEVTAPRPTDTTLPDFPTDPNQRPDVQNDWTGTTGGSRFDYAGSPYGQFNYITPTITGAPTDMFNTPRSFTTLDPTRINERAAGTTPELFQGIPGLFIQRTNLGGGSLNIRGRAGNQNLIMVDGIPINDASWRIGNVQYLNTIDEGVIERIEVIRGPASVLYGSGALGGAINIITKSRKDFSERIDLGGNLITRYSTAMESPYNRIEVTGNFQNFGFIGGGDYLNNGNYYAGEGITFPEDIVAYSQRAADIRLDWHVADIWTMTFDYQHVLQPIVPRTDRFPTPLIDPTRFTNRPTFAVPQNRDFGYFRIAGFDDTPGSLNGLQLTFALQQRREGDHELDLTRTPPRERDAFERDINGYVDLRGFTNITANNVLTYGTTFAHDSVYASRKQRTGTGPFTFITPILPPDGTYDQYGLFVEDRQLISDWLALNAGIRYSNINAEGTAGIGTPQRVRFDRSFQDWSGELGAVVMLNDNWNVVGSISEGFRAPNLEDLGSSDRSTGQGQDFGAINLNSERATVYETGVKHRGDWYAGAVTWYFSDNPSQIVRTTAPGGGNVRTNTSGYIRGFELEGNVLLTNQWSIFYTGSHTYGQDTTFNAPLSRINPAFIVLGTRWANSGPRVGLFLEGWTEMMARQTRLATADLSDIRIPIGGEPGWQTWNLRAGLDMHDAGQVTLGLYNIFDQNYRVFGSGIDGAGIDFRVGYQLCF